MCLFPVNRFRYICAAFIARIRSCRSVSAVSLAVCHPPRGSTLGLDNDPAPHRRLVQACPASRSRIDRRKYDALSPLRFVMLSRQRVVRHTLHIFLSVHLRIYLEFYWGRCLCLNDQDRSSRGIPVPGRADLNPCLC